MSAVSTLGLFSKKTVLVVAWGAAIGPPRGVLRVCSGALMVDTSSIGDRARAVASNNYLAGLDLDKILGPPIARIAADVVGLSDMFFAIGLAFGLIYVILARPMSISLGQHPAS